MCALVNRARDSTALVYVDGSYLSKALAWGPTRLNPAYHALQEAGYAVSRGNSVDFPFQFDEIAVTQNGRKAFRHDDLWEKDKLALPATNPEQAVTGIPVAVEAQSQMSTKTIERLQALREALAQITPYPWANVERWTASAEPFFATTLAAHGEAFHRITKEPEWAQGFYVARRDRWTGEASDNIEVESRRVDAANSRMATLAHSKLLAFVDSVLQLTWDAQTKTATSVEYSSKSETLNMTTPDKSKVFIIHGRNLEAAKQMGYFVRSLGLTPINFDELRASMGGTPTVADIVERGMNDAQGVIALFTADEYAGLRPDFRHGHDRAEDIMRWQARPNVLFEAGMAFGRDRTRVVFVLLGEPKLFTDVAGVHVLRPTNDPKGHRATLMNTLASGMKCAVTPHSTDWMSAGDLESCVKSPLEVSALDPFRH